MLSILDFQSDITPLLGKWPAFDGLNTDFKKHNYGKLTEQETQILLTRMKNRMAKGQPFLPSDNDFTKIIVLNVIMKNGLTPKSKQKIDSVTETEELFKGIVTNTDLQRNVITSGIYICIDDISELKTKGYEVIGHEFLGDALKSVSKISSTWKYTIENWVNIALNSGPSEMVPISSNFLRNMFSAIRPTCFADINRNKFLELTSKKNVRAQWVLTDSPYYYVTISGVINGMSVPVSAECIVTKKFVTDFGNNVPIKEILYELMYTRVGKQYMIGLLYDATAVELLKVQPSFYDTTRLKWFISRQIADYPLVVISASKGSGKSTVGKIMTDLGHLVIDSDDYGRLMTIISNKKLEKLSVVDIANIIIEEMGIVVDDVNLKFTKDLSNVESMFEYIAAEFCKNNNITLDLVLKGLVPMRTFRKLGAEIHRISTKKLPLGDFFTAIGMVRAICFSHITPFTNQRTFLFVHDSSDLIFTMGTAYLSIEPVFEPLTAILSRQRDSDTLAEVMLHQYYIYADGQLAFETPVAVLVDILKDLRSVKLEKH